MKSKVGCGIEYQDGVVATLHQFSESLGLAIDAKDPHTHAHSEEVAVMAYSIALAMKLSPMEADIIHIAGHLHDIGKIGVPDEILSKKGPLTGHEWSLIRKHPGTGADICKPVALLRKIGVVDMVLHHHERFDGNGYPSGLRGADIPLGARIIALADSISAMLQNRPYREAMSFDEAVDEVIACSGAQFDPAVVEAFLSVTSEVRCARESVICGTVDEYELEMACEAV